MNKIILFSMILLLSFSFVSAQRSDFDYQNLYQSQYTQEIAQKLQNEERITLQNSFGNITYIAINNTGLQEMSMQLEQLNTQEKLRIQNLIENRVEYDGENLYVYGKERERLFGFIPLNRNVRYEVNDNQLIKQQSRFDFLWRSTQ